MSICPFTTFRPTPFGGKTPRRKGQRGILHVAVSERAELPPWNGNTWTFYVNKAGAGFQYVDTDFCAWANVDANPDAVSIETQGGVNDPDHELWTPPQAATIARIIRWVHDDEGTPITLLPDSMAGRRGWGPHRLGIDPWRVPGGQTWSSSRGKLCPGAGKIGQIPGILRMAAGNGEDDDMQISDRIPFTVPSGPDAGKTVSYTVGEWIAWTNWWAGLAASQAAGLSAAVDKLAAAVAAGDNDLTAEELRQAVSQGIQDGGAAIRAAMDTGGSGAPDQPA